MIALGFRKSTRKPYFKKQSEIKENSGTTHLQEAVRHAI